MPQFHSAPPLPCAKNFLQRRGATRILRERAGLSGRTSVSKSSKTIRPWSSSPIEMSKKQRTGILAVHAPLEAQIVRGSRNSLIEKILLENAREIEKKVKNSQYSRKSINKNKTKRREIHGPQAVPDDVVNALCRHCHGTSHCRCTLYINSACTLHRCWCGSVDETDCAVAGGGHDREPGVRRAPAACWSKAAWGR